MAIMLQIALIDIVFSLDSVITAMGMIDHHPSIKILTLSFLIMVGMMLMVEGFGVHVPKGYIYVAMAFSLAVERLNIRLRSKRAKAVRLRCSSQAPESAE